MACRNHFIPGHKDAALKIGWGKSGGNSGSWFWVWNLWCWGPRICSTGSSWSCGCVLESRSPKWRRLLWSNTRLIVHLIKGAIKSNAKKLILLIRVILYPCCALESVCIVFQGANAGTLIIGEYLFADGTTHSGLTTISFSRWSVGGAMTLS